MKFSPILYFINSREAAHRLYLLVQLFGGVQAAETLKEFEQGKIQLLISTDAAARGIVINGVKCVVNYDYLCWKRVGRTARAGKVMLVVAILQENNFLQMVKDAGTPGIQKQIVKPEHEKHEQTLLELGNIIKVL
uniref:Helicase C-terminal domain-containing protein n=1 Tax=Salmo trutta TaxID=8032 RepID=A0A673ZLE1_SALTR